MTLEEIREKYSVVAKIDLGTWSDDYAESAEHLRHQLQAVYQTAYTPEQRIVFLHTKDYYVQNTLPVGVILRNLQTALNEQDISNFFAVVLSTNVDISQEMAEINSQSSDPVPVEYYHTPGEFHKITLERHPYSRKEEYQYGSANPIKIKLADVSERHRYLLSESPTFCIYPWVHMHAWPTGEAYPCCHATQHPNYGSVRTHSLEQIWNDEPMRALRRDMLNNVPNETCRKCHEQEDSGFFSGRQSANKHHGHHIGRVDQTQPNGTLNQFEMTYWDIRF